MPVVGRDHHHPARFARLAQQRQQQPQVLQCPALMQLIRAAQMVVHGVVDHAHHTLLGARNRGAHLWRQVGRIRQVALVEQPGWRVRAAVRQQGSVRCEAGLLLR